MRIFFSQTELKTQFHLLIRSDALLNTTYSWGAFGIDTTGKEFNTELFASVIFKENILNEKATYSISYKEDFNPNKQKLILFSSQIELSNLPEKVLEFCQWYYQQLNVAPIQKKEELVDQKVVQESQVYQCQSCFTVYDSNYGDSFSNISEGVFFSELPETYCCPICEAPISEYKKVSLELVKAIV